MERLTVDQLVHQFQVNHRSHYTGRVDLQLAKGECWSLYFQLGRLVGNRRGSPFPTVVSQLIAILSRN
jgi:hypothetical protein